VGTTPMDLADRGAQFSDGLANFHLKSPVSSSKNLKVTILYCRFASSSNVRQLVNEEREYTTIQIQNRFLNSQLAN
jgi:hypothetical protein